MGDLCDCLGAIYVTVLGNYVTVLGKPLQTIVPNYS